MKIGNWKNLQAFTGHYLRLGAPLEASKKVWDLVHKTSPGISDEPELSRTPSKRSFVKGGMDKEGEALRTGEPTNPPIMEENENEVH